MKSLSLSVSGTLHENQEKETFQMGFPIQNHLAQLSTAPSGVILKL